MIGYCDCPKVTWIWYPAYNNEWTVDCCGAHIRWVEE
jgi:hypothetical protein